MKILVCGSEGRIMSHVIPQLLAAGHSVIGIDNGQKWGIHTDKRPYELLWGDCTQLDLTSVMKRVDGVIQAAATLYGVVGFHRYPASILSDDLIVQRNVLQCALESSVKRVVYISSSMVYDKLSHNLEEDKDLALPVTDYGLSKLVCERLLQAYSRQYGMEYMIWRPFNVLDPAEQQGEEPGIGHVVPDLLNKLINLQQNPVEILGDGHQVRCFAHVEEVAEAIAEFSFDKRTKNGIYNIGRREPISVRELALRIYEKACSSGLIDSPAELEFSLLPVPSSDIRERIGDFSRIEEEVGWESSISLDEMLDDCINELQFLNSEKKAQDDALFKSKL